MFGGRGVTCLYASVHVEARGQPHPPCWDSLSLSRTPADSAMIAGHWTTPHHVWQFLWAPGSNSVPCVHTRHVLLHEPSPKFPKHLKSDTVVGAWLSKSSWVSHLVFKTAEHSASYKCSLIIIITIKKDLFTQWTWEGPLEEPWFVLVLPSISGLCPPHEFPWHWINIWLKLQSILRIRAS